jgi:hypothetical protein
VGGVDQMGLVGVLDEIRGTGTLATTSTATYAHGSSVVAGRGPAADGRSAPAGHASITTTQQV